LFRVFSFSHSLFAEFHYHTQTRGERTTQAARIVGEAIYEVRAEGSRAALGGSAGWLALAAAVCVLKKREPSDGHS